MQVGDRYFRPLPIHVRHRSRRRGETVEDQVGSELEVLVAPRPHNLADDLGDVWVLVRGELAEDVGRNPLRLLSATRNRAPGVASTLHRCAREAQ